jgi:putative acetyltransferase
MITIRPERPADVGAIRRVLETAFPTAVEANLVEALRSAGRLSISLVADDGGEVIGHVAFSPVTAAGVAAGLGMAPVSVLPARQRQGVGSRLIREGLAECARAGCAFVVVLGDPAYYGRFGWNPASALGLGNEYGVADEFMGLELTASGAPRCGGVVCYSPEFAGISAAPHSEDL